MKQINVADFRAQLKAQGVENKHMAVKCPICSTVQSMNDFVKAGKTPKEAERLIGFSCIGRVTGAGSAMSKKKRKGDGCDWTLGGLFKLHKLEVVTEDGEKHPSFELASPDEAQAHAAELQPVT